jgi:hypothetical protein
MTGYSAVSRGSVTIRVYIQRERCSQEACFISASMSSPSPASQPWT